MRIGILGGSFDPIHKGHLAIAQESEKQFQLDKVLFVPAQIPPHKIGDPKLSPAPLRARMVELALLGEPRWELCERELARSGVSYTVDTLRELRKIYPPPHSLYFIVGADSFHELKNWKEPGEILNLSEWIVAPRPSFELPSPLPPRFHLLKLPAISISASELREKIKRGEDVSEWIPEKVQEFLRRMRIYEEKSR